MSKKELCNTTKPTTKTQLQSKIKKAVVSGAAVGKSKLIL